MFVGSPEWVDAQVGATAGTAVALARRPRVTPRRQGDRSGGVQPSRRGIEGEGVVGAIALADKVVPSSSCRAVSEKWD